MNIEHGMSNTEGGGNVRDSPTRIATRSSRLALWQANDVARRLKAVASQRDVVLVEISTAGDRDRVQPLASFGGFGVFTREVQRAVLDGRADVAVHSLKDLPTESAPGLLLAAVPERASVSDALVLQDSASRSGDAVELLHTLTSQARVGTGSLRRKAQLLHLRPDLRIEPVRGNVETRLRKLDDGAFDALILAEAGLRRLDLDERIAACFPPQVLFPAVGQGALGIECRSDDDATLALLQQIDEPATRAQVTAERALLAELRAGCHAPVGAATTVNGHGPQPARLTLEAVVLSADGSERLHARVSGTVDEAGELGRRAAALLRDQGADRLVETFS